MTEVSRALRQIEPVPDEPAEGGLPGENVLVDTEETLNGQRTPLAVALERQLDEYFVWLEGRRPHPIYDLVLQAVERPLFEYVMKRCRNNQCAAAKLLGINRNTLRKKLADHGLLPSQRRGE